jgi:fatty acid elongase 3
MINYYIKYVELIDTVFLVLKKKPLGASPFWMYSFLFLMISIPPRLPPCCYCRALLHSARGRDFCRKSNPADKGIKLTSQQWVVISLNLTVHVIMCKLIPFFLGHKLIARLLLLRYCWWCPNLGKFTSPLGGHKLTLQWKKYLTTLQITQFVIDLFIVFFASKLPTPSPVTQLTRSLLSLRLQVQLPQHW